MGEAQRPVHIYVSSFGPFHGVAENPTQLVAARLAQELAESPLPSHAQLCSCRVLPVVATEAAAIVAEWPPAQETPPAAVRVVVHLGVHCQAKAFHVVRERDSSQPAFSRLSRSAARTTRPCFAARTSPAGCPSLAQACARSPLSARAKAHDSPSKSWQHVSPHVALLRSSRQTRGASSATTHTFCR